MSIYACWPLKIKLTNPFRSVSKDTYWMPGNALVLLVTTALSAWSDPKLYLYIIVMKILI